jgi:uncharacterized membrane protein
MLKLFKVGMSVCLTTPLLVFISTIGNQPSAHAWTKFCNKKDVAVQVAYARNEEYHPYDDGGLSSGKPEDEGYTYVVKGWYTVNPGDCVTVSNKSAYQVIASNKKGVYYIISQYYAKTESTNSSSGKDKFCVRTSGNFENKATIGAFTNKKFECNQGFSPVAFKRISTNKNNHTVTFTATSSAVTPPACKQGYVFREAGANDRVCVTPQVRTQTRNENAAAASRREPNGGPYGPDTCKQGYVWREAIPNDRVCVTPQVRSQAAEDNQRSTERRVPKG